jgi:hypothetical protein
MGLHDAPDPEMNMAGDVLEDYEMHRTRRSD